MAAWASVFVTTVGLVFISWQVRQAATQVILSARTFELSSFGAVVSLDVAIASARSDMMAASIEYAKAHTEGAHPTLVEAYRLKMQAHQELVRNLLDRLCSGIIQGFFDEVTYRADYREIVQNEAESLPHSSRHRNIADVHAAWSKDQSALRTARRGASA